MQDVLSHLRQARTALQNAAHNKSDPLFILDPSAVLSVPRNALFHAERIDRSAQLSHVKRF